MRTAIYNRPPGLEEKRCRLTLPDFAFPALQFGYLRSGPTGRDSCLVLSASDWGSHHHDDSLNLYYWQNGKELPERPRVSLGPPDETDDDPDLRP